MSFLGDIVDSIGGDKVPAPPRPSSRPLSANSSRPLAALNKSASHLQLPPNPSSLNGTKRKAEDAPVKIPEKIIRPNPLPGLTSSLNRRAAPPLNAPKAQSDKSTPATKPSMDNVLSPKTAQPVPLNNIAPPSGPAPAKGSYADIMARAKQASEQRIPGQVGLIKHQTTTRDKASKLAERRREEQDRAKGEKLLPKPKSGDRSEKKRSVSPAKREKAFEAKIPRPPLSAPQSKYKGTMGIASSRSAQRADESKNKGRYDEYLGTDEEDNSEAIEDEEAYKSDASSDMEAGAFDIDIEEEQALRVARADDAREKALEEQLKREKEERRRRLEGLANKRK